MAAGINRFVTKTDTNLQVQVHVSPIQTVNMNEIHIIMNYELCNVIMLVLNLKISFVVID